MEKTYKQIHDELEESESNMTDAQLDAVEEHDARKQKRLWLRQPKETGCR